MSLATRIILGGLALAALAGADATTAPAAAQGLGAFFRNLLGGGEDEPAPSRGPGQGPGQGTRPGDEAYCPIVDIFEGGAALNAYGGRTGDSQALRHQLSIVDVARECTGQPDGSIRLKVGVEGRALIGPAGGAGGRFEAPVRFDVKVGDKIILSRARRVPVSVTGAQGEFIVVEDNIVVPANAGEYEIEVGLGSPRAAPRQPRRQR